MTSSHEKHQERLRTLARDRKAQADADWKWLLTQPQGRRCMAELLHERCGIRRQTYGEDAKESAFLNGMREVAIRLEAYWEAVAPDEFELLEAECRKARREAALLAQETPTHDD